jgi:hypothetical protein
MQNRDRLPALRLVEADLRPAALRDPRVLRDFVRVREAAGIVDPETGLIRSRSVANPSRRADLWGGGTPTACSAGGFLPPR